ncbi:hypothetical protein J7G16_004200 [Vibrio parahaemolyticus]|nr:hypothetical protein [Vibrio parahaemolyticus]
MTIASFLEERIKNSRFNQSELVAQLNLYHTDFFAVDGVTLNRWINGRTIPSLKRQLLLCEFFKYDRLQFIDLHLESKRPKKMLAQLHAHYYKKETSVFNPSAGIQANTCLHHDHLIMKQYIQAFRRNVVYQPIHDIMDSTLENISVNVVHNRINNDELHFSFVSNFLVKENISKITQMLGLKSEDFKSSLSYFPLARLQNFELASRIYYVVFRDLICNIDIHNSTIIKATINAENFRFFDSMGFDLVSTYRSGPIMIYYLKMDALDFFSHPLVIDIMQDSE